MPALSRSLRRLERLVGAPLFERSSRGLTLTEPGRRLQQPAGQLIAHADAVEAQAHAEARHAGGVLKIGAVDVYPINAAIADACRDLGLAERPVIAEVVSLPWLAHPRALLERTIDVGFTLTVDDRTPAPKALRSRPLWDETEIFALISDRHPLATADMIDPRDLAGLPLHLPDKTDSPDIYSLELEILADAGVPAPRRAEHLDTMASVIANIAAGNGWMFSTRTVALHLPPGVVARKVDVASRHKLEFQIIWHVSTDSAIVDAVTESIQPAVAQRSGCPDEGGSGG